jgi:DnaK suppressor protein
VTDLGPDDPRDVPGDVDELDPAAPKDSLEAERDHLSAQLGDLGRGEGSLDFDDNFADSGQVAAEQGENRVLATQLREQLDDVERALAKLDDGTYGRCEICSAPIGASRLEAMPAARFCIDHAG